MSVYEKTRYPGIRKYVANGRYNAQIKQHQTVVASATFDTLDAARKWRGSEVLKYADTAYSARLGRTRLREVVAAWLDYRKSAVAESTLASDQYTMGKLPDRLMNRSVKAITAAELQRLFDDWNTTLKTASVRRYGNSFKALFSWALRKGYIVSNPMEAVEIPKTHDIPRDFHPRSVSEILAIADTVGGVYGDTIAVLALSGMRWGEGRAMRVCDVHVDGMNSRFHVVRSQVEGKNEKPPKSWKARYVPIDPRLLDRVQELIEGKKPGDYLLSADGKTQLWRSRFCQSVKWKVIFPDMTIHDLRHTAAVNWLKAGIPVNSVQAWLGHADLKMTTRYTSFLGMDVDQFAYKKLWAAGR